MFLAQFFGIELSLGQQIMVMLVCILGGIGTAGVPAGSLPVVALILAMVGIDPQAIALVLGVDRFLDMCRTTLNVVGDLVAAQVISAGEPHDGSRRQAKRRLGRRDGRAGNVGRAGFRARGASRRSARARCARGQPRRKLRARGRH